MYEDNVSVLTDTTREEKECELMLPARYLTTYRIARSGSESLVGDARIRGILRQGLRWIPCCTKGAVLEVIAAMGLRRRFCFDIASVLETAYDALAAFAFRFNDGG